MFPDFTMLVRSPVETFQETDHLFWNSKEKSGQQKKGGYKGAWSELNCWLLQPEATKLNFSLKEKLTLKDCKVLSNSDVPPSLLVYVGTFCFVVEICSSPFHHAKLWFIFISSTAVRLHRTLSLLTPHSIS